MTDVPYEWGKVVHLAGFIDYWGKIREDMVKVHKFLPKLETMVSRLMHTKVSIKRLVMSSPVSGKHIDWEIFLVKKERNLWNPSKWISLDDEILGLLAYSKKRAIYDYRDYLGKFLESRSRNAEKWLKELGIKIGE